MTQRDPVLRNLQVFATKSARVFMDLPIEIKLGNLPIEIIGKQLSHTFAAPYVRRLNGKVVGYGVLLDQTYYNAKKGDIFEIQQTILHELAHINVDKDRVQKGLKVRGHTKIFKKTARQLGCDSNHLRSREQDPGMIPYDNPVYRRVIKEHIRKNPRWADSLDK